MYLHTGTPDGPVILGAGDLVPDGWELGGHLLADEDEGGVADESGDQPEAAPEAPSPTSGAAPEQAKRIRRKA